MSFHVNLGEGISKRRLPTVRGGWGDSLAVPPSHAARITDLGQTLKEPGPRWLETSKSIWGWSFNGYNTVPYVLCFGLESRFLSRTDMVLGPHEGPLILKLPKGDGPQMATKRVPTFCFRL